MSMKVASLPSACSDDALPSGIRKSRENFVELANVFKQLNAPKGELGRASLVWSNRSVTAPIRSMPAT